MDRQKMQRESRARVMLALRLDDKVVDAVKTIADDEGRLRSDVYRRLIDEALTARDAARRKE